MPRPTFLISMGFVIVCISALGCVKCRYTAYAESLKPLEEVEAIAPARAKVYTFLMQGVDLLDSAGMTDLRDQLIQAGYSKIYTAQRFDKTWYREELHRLHREDSDNRFILVGYGAGTRETLQLAEQVASEEIPLDAVVLIDPIWTPADKCLSEQLPIYKLTSHNWRGGTNFRILESLNIPNVGHQAILNHPVTVDYLLERLRQSARLVPVPLQPVECLPMRDDKIPVPRPNEPKVTPPPPPGWEFLCPNPRY